MACTAPPSDMHSMSCSPAPPQLDLSFLTSSTRPRQSSHQVIHRMLPPSHSGSMPKGNAQDSSKFPTVRQVIPAQQQWTEHSYPIFAKTSPVSYTSDEDWNEPPSLLSRTQNHFPRAHNLAATFDHLSSATNNPRPSRHIVHDESPPNHPFWFQQIRHVALNPAQSDFANAVARHDQDKDYHLVMIDLDTKDMSRDTETYHHNRVVSLTNEREEEGEGEEDDDDDDGNFHNMPNACILTNITHQDVSANLAGRIYRKLIGAVRGRSECPDMESGLVIPITERASYSRSAQRVISAAGLSVVLVIFIMLLIRIVH